MEPTHVGLFMDLPMQVSAFALLPLDWLTYLFTTDHTRPHIAATLIYGHARFLRAVNTSST